MKKFNYSLIKDKIWDDNTINNLNKVYEENTKFKLSLEKYPKELETLIDVSKLKAIQISSMINQLELSDFIVKQLIEKERTPRWYEDKEVAGYIDAFNIIDEQYDTISITPSFILELHKVLFSYLSDSVGGEYRNDYNNIYDKTSKDWDIIFKSLPAENIPKSLEELCEEYNKAISKEIANPLILASMFIHDFLCIRPFKDGNGRISRLLTTLLLYKSGYFIGKYIPLEAKYANNMYLYNGGIRDSQIGWHENNNDIIPFLNYLLSIMLSAYNDFEEKVELIPQMDNTIEIVRKVIKTKIGAFTKQEIQEYVPFLNSTDIEKNLKKLCKLEEIRKENSGRYACYIKLK